MSKQKRTYHAETQALHSVCQVDCRVRIEKS